MRISRIHVPELPDSVGIFPLPDQAAHYVKNVLRLKTGSEVILFTGMGKDYSAKLVSVEKKSVTVELLSLLNTDTESSLTCHLGLGLTRGERMDYAIQKATELGVTSITPLFTERCEVKLKGNRIDKRLAHWQQVAISACEQSGRTIIPTVHPPENFVEWVSTCQSPAKIILDHRQASQLSPRTDINEITLVTGPEGGFTQQEIEEAIKAGFETVVLGKREMRAETAPVAALAVLQFCLGDFGEN